MMKCAECRRSIFLYRELTENARQEINEHIETCPECSKVFSDFTLINEKIRSSIKSSTGVPVDSQLTNRIMSEIYKERERPVSILEQFLPAFRFGFVKLAFGLVSLAITGFFLYEVDPARQAGKVVAIYRNPAALPTVQLNSAAIRGKLRERLGNEGSKTAVANTYSECFAACNENANSDGCRDCENRLKKIKGYDGI